MNEWDRQYHKIVMSLPKEMKQDIEIRARAASLSVKEYMTATLEAVAEKLWKGRHSNATRKVILTDEIYVWGATSHRTSTTKACLEWAKQHPEKVVLTDRILKNIELRHKEHVAHYREFGVSVDPHAIEGLIELFKKTRMTKDPIEPSLVKADSAGKDAHYYQELAVAEKEDGIDLITLDSSLLTLANPWTYVGAHFVQEHPNIRVMEPAIFVRDREIPPPGKSTESQILQRDVGHVLNVARNAEETLRFYTDVSRGRDRSRDH